MTVVYLLAGLLAAYFLGAIPTGLLIGKISRGVDLREHGSKNIGFTNAVRVLGPALGIPVLLIDVGKAWAAVVLLPALFPGMPEWFPVALGAAALVGNMANAFLGFRGGKGVATGLGVFLGLMPLAVLIGLGVFLAVLGLTRYVSAGSLSATTALTVAAAALYGWGPSTAIALGATVAVFWKHRANIRRLLAGTESRVGKSPKSRSAGTGQHPD